MRFKKLIYITCGLLALSAVSAAFLNGFNAKDLFLRLRATNVSMGEILFDKANTTKNRTTNTTVASSQTGGRVVCKTFDNVEDQSTGYIGALTTGSTIKFYEPDGTTEFTFEDLEKIEFTHTGTSFGFDLTGIYDDGTSFSITYSAKTTNPRTINFHDYGNVSHIRVTTTSAIATLLKNIKITYNCTQKQQTGVEVSTMPTKTSYTEGETFDPTGMVVKAVYSNGAKVVTQAYTYSPTTALTVQDTSISVYHRGFSTTVPITVSAASSISGTYTLSYWSIDFDNCRYVNGSEILYFTYTISGTSITFTYVSGDNTAFGSNRLFDGGSSPVPNTTGQVTSGTTISVTTYNAFGGSNKRTFTKS